MVKKLAFSFTCCVLVSMALAKAPLTKAQLQEMYTTMVPAFNHSTPAYRSAVASKMLMEATYFAERLNLPTPHPIEITDIPAGRFPYLGIAPPWFSIIHETNFPHWPVSTFGTNIYSAALPLDARLRSLEVGVNGTFETTNFAFYFADGKLREVMRLSAPLVERYARHLDELVGKQSLIDTNGAYELATQWLAAVDIDMAALRKLKWAVNQLHYKARGATNYVTLPLYYVDFGNKHFPARGNLHAFDEPLVSVEILGTTKELQDLTINDLSLSRRPLLLITNALDLIRAPMPPLRQPARSPDVRTNSALP